MVGEEEELEERRNAELEFISCAYAPEEAWCDKNANGLPEIRRRLKLPGEADNFSLLLTLHMPPGYPESQSLEISCSVEETKNASVARAAYKAMPKLVEACREQAVVGEESVLVVLSRAEEWIEDNWSSYLCIEPAAAAEETTTSCIQNSLSSCTTILGRRLIYSHHIISKIKRGDIHNLASDCKLTGYMKIGWPGLILIEGAEEDCVAFYDEIRPWCWKFLVVRGEQQERVREVDTNRKFDEFIETDDMSRVAQHCREVGLEALFRTAMKVYDNSHDDVEEDDNDVTLYGVLVYVDHMNDSKGYRKWLRKTAKEVDCFLVLKQSYPNHDFSNRPLIIVAIVGEKELVQQFLQRWRTSRVDVDSRGKSCLERMMTVLMECPLDHTDLALVDWDEAQAEDSINVSSEQLHNLVASIGGNGWNEALNNARK